MNEMQKSQPPLHIKNPQKQQPTASENQKRSKLRSPRELTVCAISRQTPINGSEANKQGLRSKMCQKSYLKTNIHRYVAKTESQQRGELHIRTLQTDTTCSPSASVPLEQSINTFSEGNIKQTQFHI